MLWYHSFGSCWRLQITLQKVFGIIKVQRSLNKVLVGEIVADFIGSVAEDIGEVWAVLFPKQGYFSDRMCVSSVYSCRNGCGLGERGSTSTKELQNGTYNCNPDMMKGAGDILGHSLVWRGRCITDSNVVGREPEGPCRCRQRLRHLQIGWRD